ncbi:hypothetical protein [Undibacterium terreum]|uniref:Uncharacterized protein n=1 Tax=Undibacterium terreum TaxID=1224302 RepID=A0A916UP49_9BURK|nr:hypothetical protein [Undibacterium terreum]GGC81028.1 hypothetical protein GCM10011396_30290 [Undibacterium terreum]
MSYKFEHTDDVEISEPLPDQASTIERDEHTRTHYRNDRVSYTHKELEHVTEKRELAPSKSLKASKPRSSRELRC